MKKNYILICLSLAFATMGSTFDHNAIQTNQESNAFTEELNIAQNDSTLKELKRSIPLGDAKEVKTEIYFTVGDLYLSAGSENLSVGTYRYFRSRWSPHISYTEKNQIGYLKISSRDERIPRSYGNLDQCDWDINLNSKVRHDLTIRYVGGNGHIDLQNCNLERFDFSMTAGELDINLRNSSVPDFKFKALAGEAVIDLSGTWNNSLNANITGGFGELVLKLPKNSGIRLNIHGFIGSVDISGFDKEGRIYTNELYGKTRETLYIDFIGGIGNVEIILVD